MREISKTTSGTHSPPNNCMPSRAKMRMKRNSRKRSEIIERMLLSNEMTRFLSDDQYLQTKTQHQHQQQQTAFIAYLQRKRINTSDARLIEV